ncbi:MAG: hypothetical protein NDI60_03850 [Elusimicrobiales bacterium]|nr:hypothetical protein [Elusimicrobiales bacterium]
MKAWVRVAVIRLNRIAPARFLFKSYYSLAWAVFSRLVRLLFPELTSVKLHRGYASGGWEPGASDIDVLLELRELTPEETAAFMAEWEKFYRVFRYFFPVMGEPVMASAAEGDLYARWGDIRAFSRQRPAGPPPALVPVKTALDLWTEGLHAHTRLCKIAVSRDLLPGPLAARELRKCVLDVVRHSAAAPQRPPDMPPASRLETQNRLRTFRNFPGAELEDVLLRSAAGSGDGRALKPLAQLACAYTANILERDAALFLRQHAGHAGPAPRIEGFSARPREERAALSLLKIFKSRFGELFDSAIVDNLFNSVVVLKHVPGPEPELACSVSILDSMAAWDQSLRGPVFLLGRRSLELSGLGAFEDDPLKLAFPKVLDTDRDRAVCLHSGKENHFSFHRRTFFCRGEGEPPAPGQPLLDAVYRESLAHFLRTWRGLLPAGPAGAVYAVSRAASLWLYFCMDTPVPCFPLQPLLETFTRDRLPGRGQGLFEKSLLRGLQPQDMELIAAINAETLQAAAARPEVPGQR